MRYLGRRSQTPERSAMVNVTGAVAGAKRLKCLGNVRIFRHQAQTVASCSCREPFRSSSGQRAMEYHLFILFATRIRFTSGYPLLKCIQTNVKREKMPSPTFEIAVTGVQNRRILSGLLLRRLAAKNKAKNETARIQNKGEKRLSRKTPATAAKPIALELLIPQRAETSPGPSRATNIAATALRTPRRVTGLPPGYSTHSIQKRFLVMVRC